MVSYSNVVQVARIAGAVPRTVPLRRGKRSNVECTPLNLVATQLRPALGGSLMLRTSGCGVSWHGGAPCGNTVGMATRQSKSSAPRTGAGAANGPLPYGAPLRSLEVETKLEIGSSAELPELGGRRALEEVGLATVAQPVVFELDAVYFDTADLDLLTSKLTLRHRTGGEDAGWHLKLPAAAGARTEVALPPERGDFDPFAARVPAALADLVMGAARGKQLRPVARLRNRRTVRRLLDDAGVAMVELADDQVTANTLLSSDTSDTEGNPLEGKSWRELEVEVLAGDRSHLSAVVSLLRDSGATPASSASKLARALNHGAPAPTRKSKAAGPAVVAALGKLRDNLISTDRALREGTDVALRDARATARRIRSVLAVHAPLFASVAARHLRGELRYLGGVLSSARDLEVLRRRLAGQLEDEPGEYATAASATVDSGFAAVLPAALAQVAELIRSERYLAMLRELDTFLGTPPFSRRADKPASAELSAQLAAAWRELGALAEKALADPFDDSGFHDVRKAVKTLRYAAEADSTTLGENFVVFAATIEEVQEVLGEHQDSLTSAAWLAELALRPNTDGMSGFVFGRLHAFEQAVAAGTVDDFADAWARVTERGLPSPVVNG